MRILRWFSSVPMVFMTSTRKTFVGNLAIVLKSLPADLLRDVAEVF